MKKLVLNKETLVRIDALGVNAGTGALTWDLFTEDIAKSIIKGITKKIIVTGDCNDFSEANCSHGAGCTRKCANP